MMTSSNGNIFRVTGHMSGEFTGPGESPTQRPVTQSLIFSLICARINGWVDNRKAGDLRRLRSHYDGIVVISNRSLCCMKIVDLFENLLRIILLKSQVPISIWSRDLFQYPIRHLIICRKVFTPWDWVLLSSIWKLIFALLPWRQSHFREPT